ncbi:trypsin-like peptidase domain-containing protein [Saccharothrix xinjiangensis]|uniref:Trypsin-like peptidase domain-containing protein n=1 Tax=Saccharothrix xinjiangensis TaxID=204798 RepID=A0ABV9XZ33_9PSEU
MSVLLNQAVVRVRGADSDVAGAGFLVASDLVVTCAHVVGAPDALVRLEFPLVPGAPGGLARVVRWQPEFDVALVRLATPVPGSAPAPVVDLVDGWHRAVRVFGFPRGNDDGVWLTARLLGPTGSGWVQVEVDVGGQRVRQGFSGAPVWDDDAGAIVGMAVAAQPGVTTAYCLPPSVFLDGLPELVPSPYRGLRPFDVGDATVFHGRGEETERLVETVARRSLVAVTGPSGVGKSSLVRAGLLPKVTGPVAVLRPEADTGVADLLAAALMPVLVPGLDPDERLARERQLAALLEPGRVRAVADDVLLFVDQFEELAELDPDRAVELLRWVEGVRTVVTLRPASLDRLLAAETGRALADGLFVLPPMTPDQLREAITAAPGAWHEPGLVDLVLRDAGGEPGALPLVQFTLDLMWARHRGVLTVAGYREIGGIAGALSRYADGVWSDEFADDDAVRRLLVQLARPDAEGRFVRRSVRVRDLDPALATVADRLARTRLVVTGHTLGGEPIVDLAHQALIDHWERLRKWLADTRDLRTWQEHLDIRIMQWQATKRDRGSLLGGAELAQADKWNPAELTPEQREYLAASRTQRRRSVRRLQAVIAVLTVLLLVVAVLAGLAQRRGDDLARQAAQATARVLAAESVSRQHSAPTAALQLALAAYRADPESAEARAVLLKQYPGLAQADRVFANLMNENLQGLDVSSDGDTALLMDGDGISVVTGLAQDQPRRWNPSDTPAKAKYALSPNGRWLVAGDETRLLLWDVRQQATPIVLREGPPSTNQKLQFDAASRRMVWVGAGRIELWDVETQEALPHSLDPTNVTTAWLHNNEVLLRKSALRNPNTVSGEDPNATISVHDLATGAERAVLPAGSVVARLGANYYTCNNDPEAPGPYRLSVFDTASSAPRHTIRVESCSNARLESQANFVVERPFGDDATDFTRIKIIDIDTGESRTLATPPLLRPEPDEDRTTRMRLIATFQDASGNPGVIAAIGRSLVRYRNPPPALPQPKAGWSTVTHIHDKFVARIDGDDASVIDYTTGEEAARLPASALPEGHGLYAAGFVGDWLEVTSRRGSACTVSLFSYPELVLHRRFDLPTADIGSVPDQRYAFTPSTSAIEGNRLVTSYLAKVTTWDVETGAMIGEPLDLAEDQVDREWLAGYNMLTVRPDRPDEIAVVHGDGTLRLWDLRTRKPRIEIGTNLRHDDIGAISFQPQFSPDGTHLAAVTRAGRIDVWNAETGHRISSIPANEVYAIQGFSDTGLLVGVETQYGATVRTHFWRQPEGRETANLVLDGFRPSVHLFDGSSLIVLDNVSATKMPLDAAVWFSRLCQAASRDFSSEELDLLPEGADTTAPCS